MKNFTQSDFEKLNSDFNSDLHIVISLHPKYRARVGGNAIELELIENGHRVFGANIDLYGHYDFETGGRSFKVSKGSMGAFNLECQASVESYKTVAEIINNFSSVRNLALDYMERYELMCKANYED
jgi:hypothetical protein